MAEQQQHDAYHEATTTASADSSEPASPRERETFELDVGRALLYDGLDLTLFLEFEDNSRGAWPLAQGSCLDECSCSLRLPGLG
eukprot:m.594195 g.594195  ORF g.594195 m.594195 type:complete len:84 (+) comp58028_c0_seq50:150-401(+)